MAVMNWLKKVAASALDPNKELRVQELKRVIINGLNTQKNAFQLKQIDLHSIYSAADLVDAAEEIYVGNLDKAWDDNVITKKEKQYLNWLQNKLEISATRAKELQVSHVKTAFETVLANAMVDGVIDAKEEAHLSHIAAQLNMSLSEFANAFFKKECEAFLRNIFLASIGTNDFSQNEWNNLLKAVDTLGIRKSDFQILIRQQAFAFVEHVLADAKVDGKISTEEKAKLTWLVESFGLPIEFCSYIDDEIKTLEALEEIANGKLPIVNAPSGLETVGGELIHCRISRCVFLQKRKLKSGDSEIPHHGKLILTDRRLVFLSETKSFKIGYRSVVAHNGNSKQIKVQVQGKPVIHFKFSSPSKFGYEIFEMALALANQTKTNNSSENRNRYISRDVRQLIWTRYGGICAECGDNQYLEFDHIIPVAKGGSNNEANVQLLCRRCNLKKSDKI